MTLQKRDIGDRIKQIRRSLKMSQEEFGREIGGKSKAAVSKYETGESSPPMEVLRVIASLGHRSFGWVVSGEDGESDKAIRSADLDTSESDEIKRLTAQLNRERDLLSTAEWFRMMAAIHDVIEDSKKKRDGGGDPPPR